MGQGDHGGVDSNDIDVKCREADICHQNKARDAISEDDDVQVDDDETAGLLIHRTTNSSRLSLPADHPKEASRITLSESPPRSPPIPTSSSAQNVISSQTLTYTAAFVILGFMVGIIGPTLPALRTNVGTSFETLGVVFFGRWCGSIAGSVLGGHLLDRVSGHAPFTAAVLVASLGAACIPMARSIPVRKLHS